MGVAKGARETGGGKDMRRGNDGSNRYNRCGNKGESRWEGESVNIATTEFREGVAMNDFPPTARVVIIGGGIVGTATLYHLSRAGWRDCVLLEKNELTAGSTWHAAGNCPHFSTSLAVMKMQAYGLALYRRPGGGVEVPTKKH